MSTETNNTNKLREFVDELKRLKVNVVRPDINDCFADFRTSKNRILYGLNAIKNVGAKALETIIAERKENGPYETIFDLCSRVDQQKVNKRVLESLIMSGSLDSIQGSRAEQFLSVDDAIKYGQQMQSETNRNQVDLFGSKNDQSDLIIVPVLQSAKDWSEKEAL